MTERRPLVQTHSLRQQMLLVVLTAVIAAVIIGLGGWLLMDYTIDHWYLAPEAMEERAGLVASELEAYVSADQLTADDYQSLRSWVGGIRDASIAVRVEYDSPVEIWLDVEDGSLSGTGNLEAGGYYFYEIPFSDRTCAVAILENSEARLYNIATFSALVAGALTVLIILLIYNRDLTRRIRTFSKDLNKISGGDLDYPLRSTSSDELGQLAKDVDTMRNTIIQRTYAEQEALKANSELITALSHDIRNPLTSLIGYMELLEMEQGSLPEDAQSYVRASLDKAYRIRDLTGELFRYFLVFSEEAQDVKLEEYDAQILLDQLLGESLVELEMLGFREDSHALEQPCTLRTDVSLFKRVIDNLTSNIQKYADPAYPLQYSAHVDDRLHITVRNHIRKLDEGAVESNHIGLRTCVSIMKLLEGSFESRAEGDTFTVEIALPIVKKSEKTS